MDLWCFREINTGYRHQLENQLGTKHAIHWLYFASFWLCEIIKSSTAAKWFFHFPLLFFFGCYQRSDMLVHFTHVSSFISIIHEFSRILSGKELFNVGWSTKQTPPPTPPPVLTAKCTFWDKCLWNVSISTSNKHLLHLLESELAFLQMVWAVIRKNEQQGETLSRLLDSLSYSAGLRWFSFTLWDNMAASSTCSVQKLKRKLKFTL